ncbi:RICIN domain-containing protein [Streptomyces sp. NPDC059828]|uniref:RICIN domain-containing protein n=1 Tax=Streptomyces sp. NPDC059828 TaxID=3346965 RepID=UPI0036626327
MRVRPLHIALSLSALIVGTLTSAGPAQAAPGADPDVLWTSLQNSATLKCLDVRARSTADGAVIQQFDCNGNSNQKFGYGQTNMGGWALFTRHAWKCVDTRGGADEGSGVVQWTCNGSGGQQWRLELVAPRLVLVRNLSSGKCLQDMGQPSGSRREVGQATCTGASHQLWNRG